VSAKSDDTPNAVTARMARHQNGETFRQACTKVEQAAQFIFSECVTEVMRSVCGSSQSILLMGRFDHLQLSATRIANGMSAHCVYGDCQHDNPHVSHREIGVMKVCCRRAAQSMAAQHGTLLAQRTRLYRSDGKRRSPIIRCRS
jgi:hypothetical protein